jgi:hypothetical protein
MSHRQNKKLAASVLQFQQENKVSQLIGTIAFIPNPPKPKAKVSKKRF